MKILNKLLRQLLTKLSRTREDQQSRVGNRTKDSKVYQKPVQRNIWRHEAEVGGLTPDIRLNYRVTVCEKTARVLTVMFLPLQLLPNQIHH